MIPPSKVKFGQCRHKMLREGCQKKNVFFMVFCQPGGGGGPARVVKKPYRFFEKSIFFREHVKSF